MHMKNTESGSRVREELIQLLPRLRRLARALTGHVDDADDLVQLVIERALVRASQWRPDGALDRWVFAIARNAWRDEIRSRVRAREVFVPEEEGAATVDDRIAPPAQRVALAEAMAALPEDHREVVALVLVEGLSYGEAADLLGVPVGTVTSRLSRARSALQDHLGSEA